MIKWLMLLLLLALQPVGTYAQQFKFNNVDTLSSPNKELIQFFSSYVAHRVAGHSADDFWIQGEPYAVKGLDPNELFDQYYPWMQHYTPTILGLSRVKENTYRLKLMVETGKDAASMMIFAIQDYLIYQTPAGFKMGSTLNYNLLNQEYVHFSDAYFDYCYPKGTRQQDIPMQENQALLQKLETYFDRKLPYRFTYIFAPDCEGLYAIRGIDYVANMMSTKTSVCGWTYTATRTMFSSYPGFHKHEVLRLLSVLTPNAPLVLADGITNLTGGAGGKSIDYHISKLAPYLKAHPEKLDAIEDFWYYDDETNPYFVFHALLTNYFLKTRGPDAFRQMMLAEEKKNWSIREFLKEELNISDLTAFYLRELDHYARPENTLEFLDFF